jgi:opacity protein-like surface antigen
MVGRHKMRLSRIAILCFFLSFLVSISSIAVAGADEPKRTTDDKRKTTEEKKEKKRVPKRTADSKEKHKDDNDESDKGDFFGSCLGSLIGDMLCSMFSGGSDSEDQGQGETELEHGSVGGTFPAAGQVQSAGQPSSEPARWLAVRDTCSVDPRVPGVDAASVWTEAGCVGAGGRFVCMLGRGSRVSVVELMDCEGVRWVNVVTLDGECPGGWMLEQHLSRPARIAEQAALEPVEHGEESLPAPQPEPAAGPEIAAMQPPERRVTVARPRTELILSVSPVAFLDRQLPKEYVGLGVNFALGVRVPLSNVVTAGARAGVQVSNGNPQYDYESATQKDFPRDSKLTIVDVGAELGLMFGGPARRPSFTIGAGPCAYYVKETATVDFLKFADSDVGIYDAEISKWRLGGQANVGLGWNLAEQFSIGASARYSFIPWKSYENASLTLDWLDRSFIDFLSLGVTVGWSFF